MPTLKAEGARVADGSDRTRQRRHRQGASGKLTLKREGLTDQVADHLRDMIVRGRLEPGARLRIADLAHMLDVSLTPLREALKVLAGEQLVELTPNRPTRIAPITVAETQSLFEVMAGIESMASELAATRMTDAELARLEQRHAEMQRCHDNDARSAYFDINREIHDLIVDYARNPVLTHLRSKLALRAERIRYLAVQKGSRRREAMAEHEAAMQALRDRDPDAARRAWRRHLLNSGTEMCRILEDERTAGETSEG